MFWSTDCSVNINTSFLMLAFSFSFISLQKLFSRQALFHFIFIYVWFKLPRFWEKFLQRKSRHQQEQKPLSTCSSNLDLIGWTVPWWCFGESRALCVHCKIPASQNSVLRDGYTPFITCFTCTRNIISVSGLDFTVEKELF